MTRDQQQSIQYWREHAKMCVMLPDGRPHPDASINQGVRRKALHQALQVRAESRI